MVPYLQLERTITGAIAPNSNVEFNRVLLTNNQIMHTPEGVLTFLQTGLYFVNWFVAQQTGLSVDGSNFAIVTSTDPDTGFTGSSHVKIAPATGFAIIRVDNVGKTIRLVNKSTHRATLSDDTRVKAGIAVFGIADATSPVAAPLGYLQAQVANGSHELNDEEWIAFDSTIVADPDNIVRKGANGEDFTLANIGTYLVTWEIPIEATDAKGVVSFDLLLNDVIYSNSFSTLPVGVLAGSALVVNPATNGVLQLVNASGDIVKIANKTNIVITQVSNTQASV